MSFSIEQTNYPPYASIRVVGVGGGGCNALTRMMIGNAEGVEFIAVNTDGQALDRCGVENTIRIGEKVTRGLGAGADPTVGAKAAEENREEIQGKIEGSDMLFITAGMGGGTGTGAAPVIAQIAREMGILTVAVVTRPFKFEGSKRMINAEAGIRELEQYVDALIVVPNDKLLELSDEETTLVQAFSMADQILRYGVMGISDLVTVNGLINLDMADVKRIMTDVGICHLGIGRASGENRMNDAIDEALHSPLLDTSIDGARKIIINFTGHGMKMREINMAASMVRDAASPEAEIIFGAVESEEMNDEVMITLIATGYSDGKSDRQVAGNGQVNFANGGNKNDNRMAAPSLPRFGRTNNANPVMQPQAMPNFLANRNQAMPEANNERPNYGYNNRNVAQAPLPGNYPVNPNVAAQQAPATGAPAYNRNASPLNPELNRQAPANRKSADRGAKILPWFYAEDEEVNE